MTWAQWQPGRQGTGYHKLRLFSSHLLKCDCYLLKYCEGAGIPPHTDPALPGYRHFRINAVLKQAKSGGVLSIVDTLWSRGRVHLFRPDLVEHSVSPVLEGTRLVLSIGWLKRSTGEET